MGLKLGKILAGALPIAAAFIPGIGPAISGALLSAGLPAGLAAAAGSSLGIGALTGGLGAAIQGKNVLKGAAMGGLGNALVGPALGKMMGAAPGVAQAGAAQAGSLAGQSFDPVMAESVRGLTAIGGEGFKTLPANLALEAGKKNILPMLAMGGLGLAMSAPKTPKFAEEENRNPNAGKERQDPRPILRPPPGYLHGGSGGEWMFFNPEDTTGAYHYADGGSVVVEPSGPIYDPSNFAGLFERPVVRAPTATPGAYGDNGPATMNWVAPPAPPQPSPAPVVQPPVPQIGPPQFGGSGIGGPVGGALDGVMGKLGSLYSEPMYLGMGGMRGFEDWTQHYAGGGHVMGPGTGTSDSIPAVIDGVQPAALSNGEYVLTKAAVDAIGGGSNKKGARKLDAFQRGIASA